jgi:hypothetical protein
MAWQRPEKKAVSLSEERWQEIVTILIEQANRPKTSVNDFERVMSLANSIEMQLYV